MLPRLVLPLLVVLVVTALSLGACDKDKKKSQRNTVAEPAADIEPAAKKPGRVYLRPGRGRTAAEQIQVGRACQASFANIMSVPPERLQKVIALCATKVFPRCKVAWADIEAVPADKQMALIGKLCAAAYCPELTKKPSVCTAKGLLSGDQFRELLEAAATMELGKLGRLIGSTVASLYSDITVEAVQPGDKSSP